MKNIFVKKDIDKTEWEEFLKKHHPEVNFLHSWYWGEFQEKLGKKVVKIGFYKKEILAGVVLGIVEEARRGRYLTVPGGPIIDWDDQELVTVVFDEIKKIGIIEKCVFVRVRPQLLEDEGEKLFGIYGFRKAPMHLHAELSNILDITKSEDEILSNMRKTTRYEIKKAMKIGVKVELSKDVSLIKKFYDLQIETAERQKFVPFSYSFFKKQFEVFFNNNMGLLYTATLGNEVLAQAFVIFYGREADYHYGVSTQAGRKYPGAYLLQWEAIREAKRRGLRRYNFWGVAPEGALSHRFYGVSVFKRGFGGEDVAFLHARDLVIDKWKYGLDYIIELLRKKNRGL